MPIVYLSLDPVRKEVNFYPKHISEELENKFKEYTEHGISQGYYDHTQCILGSNFFNATVHFDRSEGMYQTTPGFHMGRAGYKQAGYRSVRRLKVSEDDLNYSILGKRVNGEWRIIDNINDSEYIFSGEIERQYLINDQIDNILVQVPKVWKSEYLELDMDNNDNVIVWQWCRGTVENEGNLLSLGEEWWIPYFNEENQLIEKCYTEQSGSITIKIPELKKEYIIKIDNGCFGSQENLEFNTRREIKRTIMTVKTLKNKIENSRKLLSGMKLLDYINNRDDIPIEFICPISQLLMNKPVKTIDNQVYDEEYINRWFSHGKSTSPCTGLILNDLTVTPFDELRVQIEQYKDAKRSEMSAVDEFKEMQDEIENIIDSNSCDA